jgi:hypothetical protein
MLMEACRRKEDLEEHLRSGMTWLVFLVAGLIITDKWRYR